MRRTPRDECEHLVLEALDGIKFRQLVPGFPENDWEVPFNDGSYVNFKDSPPHEIRANVLEDCPGHLLRAFQPCNQLGFGEDKSAIIIELQAVP